ncbi:MAG: DUF815 domain-containing protein [Epsilonproteobacteria bacterium]|nr:DUF815 domain-containing protein [Campylobacterota bacterium]
MKSDILNKFTAFRWDNRSERIVPAKSFRRTETKLLGVDKQRDLMEKNLSAFVNGTPTVNVLLWGERGCGKSTLVHEMIERFSGRDLKAIELSDPEELLKLSEEIYNIHYRFLIFMDDLGLDDPNIYRNFKRSLDGGLSMLPENALVAATANKRHLVSEINNDDIHPDETSSEILSVSARFGLIIPFYPLSKERYLAIVKYYFKKLNVKWEKRYEKNAERWALARAGRSGRVAMQFAVNCLNGIFY